LNPAVVSQSPTSAAAAVPAYLLVHHAGRGTFAPHRLTSPIVTIGRVAGNDVVIDSPNISRRHAKLLITDMGVTAHDLDSHNGVFLNGKKIRSAPVGPGDLLYVGDVCLRVERDTSALGMAPLILVDVADEDEPAVRALAALRRAVRAAAEGKDDAWLVEALQVTREFVDAMVAVLVEVRSDGDLWPLASAPDLAGRPAPVLWPVVQQAVATSEPVFAANLRDTPLGEELAADAPGAVMAVPLLHRRGDERAVRGVLYLSRAVAGPTFGEEQFDVVQCIAGAVGLRIDNDDQRAEATTTVVAGNGMIEAQQRITSLEEQLVAAQSTDRTSSERVCALEGDLQRERREVASLREASTRHDSSTAEERRQAQAALDAVRAEQTAAVQRAQAVETALAQARAEGAQLTDAAQAEREAATARQASLAQELAQLRARLDESSAPARSTEADALRSALRASVPPVLAERVEEMATGTTPPTSMQTRTLTALHVALASFDAFCESAAPEVVRATLDRFCAAVVARAAARGGRVRQVVGHGHLVVFDADGAGVCGAVECALDLDTAFPGDDGAPGVVAGVHHGNAVMGFFGDAEATSYVEAGAPVVVARAASDHAASGALGGAPRGVVVSDAIRALVADAPGLSVTRLGPVWIPGVRAAMPLSVIERNSEGNGGKHA